MKTTNDFSAHSAVVVGNAVVGNASKRCNLRNAVVGKASKRCNLRNVTLGGVTHYNVEQEGLLTMPDKDVVEAMKL